MTSNEPNPTAIRATYQRIRTHIRRTPILEIEGAEFGAPGAHLVFKLEYMQHTGSFKARGAFANLTAEDRQPGAVAAASGGNHGAAVAYAAKQLGIPATIFIPSISSPAKIERIRSYGAKLFVGGENYNAARLACEAHVAQTSELNIRPYEGLPTVLGQGTVGLELAEQAPGLARVLIAVGGGSLIAGVAASYAGTAQIVSVEPENIPTLHAAIKAGTPVDVPVSGIAADALGATRIGALAFDIARERVGNTILVSDDAIAAAQRILWERLRIVVEPSGATALAALLSGKVHTEPGERIGIILCGANTDAVHFKH